MTVYRFGEFLSIVRIEHLILNPPQIAREARQVVKVFDQLEGLVDENGDDLLERALFECPQLMLLLSYLRLAACKRVIRLPEIACLRIKYRTLAMAFTASDSSFAKAIRQLNQPTSSARALM